MASRDSSSHSHYEQFHAAALQVVLPKIIVTRPRVQWMPRSKKGGRILVDIDAHKDIQSLNTNLDFTNHPRHSSYYASTNAPSYYERQPLSCPSSSCLNFPQIKMAQPQQHLPLSTTPTGPRQQVRSTSNRRFTGMGLVDSGNPRVVPPLSGRTLRYHRSTAASKTNMTRTEGLNMQTPQITDQIEAPRVASSPLFPSVLDPKITVTEITYDDAIANIAKETGPLLMNLKDIPSRPVDLVLYDPKGSSLAVFTLLLTREIDLAWLISWIQIFVDKWVKNEVHPEILITHSVKIRMASKTETECYPPLQGTPIDCTMRETSGPFNGYYFIKWDCHDSQMEKYWEVFRSMLQMGAGDSQKPIFKVYTMGFPIVATPANLRDQKNLAPSQYFESAKTGSPLLSKNFFQHHNNKMGYARMASSSEAAFIARELQIAGDKKATSIYETPATIPSVCTATNKGGESYRLRRKTTEPNPECFTLSNVEGLHAFPRNKTISLPKEYAGSAEEQLYIKHPQDKWVTITINGQSERVLAPYRKPVSEDPTRVWSYYQKMGGGNLDWQAAFNFDDIPFEADQFPSYKVVNGTAINLKADGTFDSDDINVRKGSFGKTIPWAGSCATFESSATLASEEMAYHSPTYDPSTVICQKRLDQYQKRSEAAKSFDSDDDDFYFPNRAQQPYTPRKRTLGLKESPFELSKSVSQSQLCKMTTTRQDLLPLTFAPHSSAQNRVQSPTQHFPLGHNSLRKHSSPTTESFRKATSSSSLTVMNPDAPSFQAHGQFGNSLRLNVNAPTFQQSTISVPPHRIIPPGYGDMTPISGTSPSISRIPSQASLSVQSFQSAPSVDSLASTLSNVHNVTGHFNPSGHKFDHFSSAKQGCSSPKDNNKIYWSKNTAYKSQAPVLGNSFRSIVYGSANNGSNYQHSQTQHQARNSHIATLNQRLQAQSQIRERQDHGRIFHRDNRHNSGNQGYGTIASNMTVPKSSQFRTLASDSLRQSISTFKTGQGELRPGLMRVSNPAAEFYEASSNLNASNQPWCGAYSGNNIELGSEHKVRSSVTCNRSPSPPIAISPVLLAHAPGMPNALSSREYSKSQVEEALKSIVANFKTQVVHVPTQSSDNMVDNIAKKEAVRCHLHAGAVASINNTQIDFSFADRGQKSKKPAPTLTAGTLGASFAFRPEPLVSSKLGNAGSFDFEKMAHPSQPQASHSEPEHANNGLTFDATSA